MKNLLWLLLSVTVGAQTPGFEVASIKPNRSGEGGSSIRVSTGLATMENVPLKKLTLWAYGIPDDREYALIGPDWLATERFNIQARFPADTPPEETRRMAQALLQDRFHLALHREIRQLPIYALVVAKNGAKIRAVEPAQNRTSGAPGRLEATGITMQKLADLLSRMLGLQVVNSTGLAGVFTFTLEWSPDETQRMRAQEEVAAAAASGASIFSVLQEQLGLKLEGRKGPVEVLVIDHIEKTPTEN